MAREVKGSTGSDRLADFAKRFCRKNTAKMAKAEKAKGAVKGEVIKRYNEADRKLFANAVDGLPSKADSKLQSKIAAMPMTELSTDYNQAHRFGRVTDESSYKARMSLQASAGNITKGSSKGQIKSDAYRKKERLERELLKDCK